MNFKYHSTGQFRNVVKRVKEQAEFSGIDSEGNVVKDHTVAKPKLRYIGTTKLHGTNASIVLHECGKISFHSKNNLLGYVENGEFTLLSDNQEFAQTMYRRFDSLLDVLIKAESVVYENYGTRKYPIKISGEWCGQGIQKCVGISFLPKKSLFIFGIKAGDTDEVNKSGWLPVMSVSGLVDSEINFHGIYAITDFPTKKVDIDFSFPEEAMEYLESSTYEVENECPVAATLGLKGTDGEPQVLGEGLVWTPADMDWCWDSGNWFKTKGQKHSVSKVKKVASINPEKLKSIVAFVDYSVTLNRLDQGISEVGLDQKLIGKFIGWVNSDINKEEGDTLEASNLSMKDVGKYVSTKAREYYIGKLKADL